MKNIVLPLIASLAFTGCATTKISEESRQKLNQTQAAIQVKPVAIFVNSCLLTNELGKDLVLIEPTKLTSEKFIQTFTQQLNQHNVTVSTSATPFICGSMPEEQLKKYEFQVDSNSKRAPISTYPLLNQNSNMTDDQRAAAFALTQFIAKTDAVNLSNVRNRNAKLDMPQLDETTVKTLKEWANSNYIFLVSLDGLNASVGSKFAMGALSVGVTLATMGAGAGIVTAYMPKEGQQYSVRLLDLDKQTFEWHKADLLKGRIYSTNNHNLQADQILNPLFETKVN
ncbi:MULTISPECIES: hypothetical protein [Acinetobacter]|uniref:hypothetical protein n=1 Tax=Acinetobacter TaxID=469 RepID=UPI000992990B|nr:MULTISPECIES: hypothetical protein [Acinetobacter]MCL6245867.1 hypothetical protein [Acinetobacter amyesii]OOV82280.1 hypothetical protein B1201_08535 [Acinetobacter sp. ANC 5600]